jgi:hypothetical protein
MTELRPVPEHKPGSDIRLLKVISADIRTGVWFGNSNKIKY